MKAGYVHCVKMADLSRCGNLVFFAPEILGKITVVTLGGSTEYSGGRKYAFLTSICLNICLNDIRWGYCCNRTLIGSRDLSHSDIVE